MAVEKYKERNEKKIVKLSEVAGKTDGRGQAKQLSLANVVKAKLCVTKAALPSILKPKVSQRREKIKLDITKDAHSSTLEISEVLSGSNGIVVIVYGGEDERLLPKCAYAMIEYTITVPSAMEFTVAKRTAKRAVSIDDIVQGWYYS
ncbi:hypothetical protein GQX74_010094 [Glossina fuscipes]|nr:hypothetical protein GQX74_010094 [Glossina fuscipes]